MDRVRVLPLLFLCACIEGGGSGYETFELAANKPTPLDILVVLDDTTAMANYLPRPGVDQLGIFPFIYNGAPDIRVAITTSTTGTLRTSPTVPDGYVEHRLDFGDGTLHTNYNGTLSYALGSLTNVGATSTAPNEVLASAERALATPGFVRDGSGVGILVISGADDASTGDPATFAAGVQAHGNPTMVSTIYADADPIPRLRAFADALPLRWLVTMSDYNMEALTVFSWLWPPQANPDWCLPVRATKVSGNYDCEMFMADAPTTHMLPQCNGDIWTASDACWSILEEPSCRSGLSVGFGGGFSMYRPHVIGRCATN